MSIKQTVSFSFSTNEFTLKHLTMTEKIRNRRAYKRASILNRTRNSKLPASKCKMAIYELVFYLTTCNYTFK